MSFFNLGERRRHRDKQVVVKVNKNENAFSSSQNNVVTAIHGLVELEDQLRARQADLEKKLDTLPRKSKNIFQTLQRQNLEGKLKQVDNQLMTVESQRALLENAQINAVAIAASSSAAAALREANAIGPEGAREIVDNAADECEQAGELSNALTQPTTSVEYSDEDLDRELSLLSVEEVADVHASGEGTSTGRRTEKPVLLSKQTIQEEEESFDDESEEEQMPNGTLPNSKSKIKQAVKVSQI